MAVIVVVLLEFFCIVFIIRFILHYLNIFLHVVYRLYAYTKNEPNHFVAFLLHPPHKYDGTTHDHITPLKHITTMSDINVSHGVYVLEECN